MHTTNFLPALALLSVTLALPSPSSSKTLSTRDGGFKVTEEQIGNICPQSKSCDRAKDDECATAKNAAKFINMSFDQYQIKSPNVAAALIATMCKESGDFKLAHNVFPAPGRPGQGTRNMQSPDFNKKYLKSILDDTKIEKSDDFKNKAKAAGDDVGKVLEVLNTYGSLDFGSAAWFLSTECKGQIAGLEKGDEAGWDAYVTCVGASAGDGRKEIWKKAIEALKAKA